jgi:hypothetical protein
MDGCGFLLERKGFHLIRILTAKTDPVALVPPIQTDPSRKRILIAHRKIPPFIFPLGF